MKRRLRPGFTVLEAAIASSLLALLAMLVSASWSGLGRPMMGSLAHSRIQEEANRAASFLADDFGGQLGTVVVGKKKKGKKAGRIVVGSAELRLCFDGGTDPDGIPDWAPPDTVVVYSLQSGCLVRTNQTLGNTITVARQVESFTVNDQGSQVKIDLKLTYRNLSRTYTFIGKD